MWKENVRRKIEENSRKVEIGQQKEKEEKREKERKKQEKREKKNSEISFNVV